MKLNRNLSLMELNDIHYIARQYYIDDEKLPTLDDQQFRAQCFTKAVCSVLQIQGVEYPVKRNCESLEDYKLEEAPSKETPKP